MSAAILDPVFSSAYQPYCLHHFKVTHRHCLVPHAGSNSSSSATFLFRACVAPPFLFYFPGTVYTEILQMRQRQSQGAPLSEALLKHPHNCYSNERLIRVKCAESCVKKHIKALLHWFKRQETFTSSFH